jgi:hypothetical protein
VLVETGGQQEDAWRAAPATAPASTAGEHRQDQIAAPRIAGQHPIYLRASSTVQDGSRNGMTSKLMAPVVKNLD